MSKVKLVKVTAKIPEHILILFKSESKRTGVGIQSLAGQVLTHGFNMIVKEQEAQSKAKDLKDPRGEQNVHTED